MRQRHRILLLFAARLSHSSAARETHRGGGELYLQLVVRCRSNKNPRECAPTLTSAWRRSLPNNNK